MSQSTESDDRRLRVFGSLCGVVFLVNFGRITFAPLLDTFETAFGVNAATVGVIASLAWLGSALPRLPTGYLLTRFDRHHVIIADGVFLAAASAGTAMAGSVTAVAVGAFLVGVASGVYFIAGNPLVSELFPDRVGRVIGIHGTASQSAAVVAPLAVGVVLGVGDWRLVFWLLAAAALLGTAALAVSSRAAVAADRMPAAGRGDRDFLGATRRRLPLVLTGILVMSVAGIVWNGFFNFYVSYVTDARVVDAATARTLLTVMFAAGIPAFWFAGRLADRLSYIVLLVGVPAAFAGSLFAFTYARGLYAVVAATVVVGYAIHHIFPTVDTFLLDSLPDADRASAYAAYSAVTMLFQAGGGVLVGGLRTAGFSYDGIFRVAAVAVAVVALTVLLAHRGGVLPTASHE
ncbi:MFS transporter [Halocalculus aciditolerans]|uniref:MFS transporter n=1 Tax=Halocalculus aciditolerans TaxID=1383812 RepID=UPI001662E92E|nr:MFS transporter [Halocalculus aciditolerans]